MEKGEVYLNKSDHADGYSHEIIIRLTSLGEDGWHKGKVLQILKSGHSQRTGWVTTTARVEVNDEIEIEEWMSEKLKYE